MTNYMTDVQNMFIETIKLIDGEPVNLDRHQERMRRTLAHLGGACKNCVWSMGRLAYQM